METASPLNAQQIEYWNGAVGEKWARLQERIDLHMNAITDAAIPFAAPRADERVLDIGCGCGTTTLLLAMRVGGEGAAAGVDISAPMLNVARARAQAQNANIAFVEADASVHDFQPVFDLVFSRFGVMFFADPAAAFANIRRALAPRGRLAFVCWRSAGENLWASVPMTAAKDLLPPQEPVDPFEPGPFAFADKDRLSGILRDAGFHGIRIEPLDSAMNMGKTLDEAAEESLNIGPLARAAAEVDAATRAKIGDAVKEAFERFQSPSGVTPPAACWLVGARGSQEQRSRIPYAAAPNPPRASRRFANCAMRASSGNASIVARSRRHEWCILGIFRSDFRTMRSLDDIMTDLRRLEPDLRRRYPIRRMGVFGSSMHGTQRENSDLDVLVDLGDGIGLMELVGLKQELSDAMGLEVDLVTAGGLRRRIGRRILSEAVML